MTTGPTIDKPATISLTVYLELLEALRELIAAEWMVPHDWGGNRRAVMDRAKAAIARAEAEL